MQRPLFHTKTDLRFPAIFHDEFNEALSTLLQEYGITYAQISEAASYSMAMVVRFALGLSALEGRVCILAHNSLASCIALATLRHLINAGSEGIIVFPYSFDSPDDDLALQLKPLEAMEVQIEQWNSNEQNELMVNLFQSCHNIICGLYPTALEQNPFYANMIEVLNEIQTPIHTIEAPLGVNVDTGAKDIKPLFASSTLSLGAPLAGLHSGSDYVGRHYLCDISLTRKIYEKHLNADLNPAFAEQPVVQIFPVKE